ncbi:peptide ligase PGM1-related protein [Streptomyces sp. LX-29]|uniref:preATP grasp domain-containing protein n=1 Tax=Streptomyces sp. LX-29 TaxID=2900152 RepID=UPI00240E6953|nr:peptide ligase PGM1-related protein [Streptomyces sp. LX-29]WFB05808.1 peptide ligase PGM1-related protein [Streptomyces sp. LX-29]
MEQQHRDPLILYANFHSDLAVDLAARDVLERWAEQAPRKIWLMRPGDVLVTPVPLSAAFQAYACDLLGMAPESLTLLHVPPVPGGTLADAVHRAGATDTLRELVVARPGIQLLPLALDRSTVDLAARLAVPIAPYGPRGAPRAALEVAYLLNTKGAFRCTAARLGMPLPPGRVCGGEDLPATVGALLAEHDRVVLKPDRSAGGHGLAVLSDTDPVPSPGERATVWVVEQCMDAIRSLSVQMEATPDGPRPVFSGEMRTSGGRYTGYLSPLAAADRFRAVELERWGGALGRYLSGHGYTGPYGIDAVLAANGRLYAIEANVRRTATTTPRVMAVRLARAAGLDRPAWLLAQHESRFALGFAEALRLLRDAGLAWSRESGAGVVLYEDAPADGRTWRYAVIGTDRRQVKRLRRALMDAWGTTARAEAG